MPFRDRFHTLRLLLAGGGLLISGVLSWSRLTGATLVCSGVGGCEAVQASRYAMIGSVPLPYIGFAYFAVIALFSVRATRSEGDSSAELALLSLTLSGLLYSLYLTYLELGVIGAICPWCVASALVVCSLFGVTVCRMRSIGHRAEPDLAVAVQSRSGE